MIKRGRRPLFHPIAFAPGRFYCGKGFVVVQLFPDMSDVNRQAVIASDGYLVLPDRIRQLLCRHNTPFILHKKAENGKFRVGQRDAFPAQGTSLPMQIKCDISVP